MLLHNLLTLGFVPALVFAGLFPKSSPVRMIDHHQFKSIMKEEKTSIVAFVAPWCGHCKNLAPEYISAAKALNPLVPLYAVDCDVMENKHLCSEQGIKGFPTVKSFPRGSKGVPHDYNGERKAAALVSWVTTEVPNRIDTMGKSSDVVKWLSTKPTQPHALLLNTQSKLPLLWRVLGNSFREKIALAVTRDKKMEEIAGGLGIDVSDGKARVIVWGVGHEFPTVYAGALKHDPLTEYFHDILEGKGTFKRVNSEL